MVSGMMRPLQVPLCTSIAMNTPLENRITYQARSGGSNRPCPVPHGKFLGYIQNFIKACLQQALLLWRYGLDIIAVAILAPLRQNKKATIASGLRKSLILMVPEAGIEPARRERRGILNPLCLPISPLGHRNRYQARTAGLSIWRHVPESNRTKRICNPLHNRFANAPCKREKLSIV